MYLRLWTEAYTSVEEFNFDLADRMKCYMAMVDIAFDTEYFEQRLNMLSAKFDWSAVGTFERYWLTVKKYFFEIGGAAILRKIFKGTVDDKDMRKEFEKRIGYENLSSALDELDCSEITREEYRELNKV